MPISIDKQGFVGDSSARSPRVLSRSRTNGPVLDLMAGEDSPAHDDDDEDEEDDNEGLSEDATKRLAFRSCAFVLLVALMLTILGTVHVSVAYLRAQSAAESVITALSGGDEGAHPLHDSMSYEEWRKDSGRRIRYHRFEEDDTNFVRAPAPDDFEPVLQQRAGRGGAPALHDIGQPGSKDFWGNAWLKAEINRLMEMKRLQINNDTSSIASGMQPEMMDSSSVVVDSFTGMESINIDKFQAFSVTSDLDAGTMNVLVTVGAHTRSPLICNGRAASGKKKNPWYHFTIQVNDFWMNARRISGVADLGLPPVLNKASVGWVDTGFGRLDATCYSKKDPRKVDGLCTDFLKGKLKKERNKMNYKVSKKITEVLQEKLDKEMVGGYNGY